MSSSQLQPPKATVRQLAYKIKGSGQTPFPRFAFFLGAGASVESGIPLAGSMMADFGQQIIREQCPENCGDERQQQTWLEQQPWYSDAQRDGTLYSELFERCEMKERGRQLYIEQMIEGKEPSFGYVVLANLMARKYINTVITTNFDDLVYNACSTFTDIRPVVYAYGTMVSDLRVTSSRPKILKLHGDYLYSKLKNSGEELAHQDPNMSHHVSVLLNEYGLVVIGYSGCDKSVMDLLRRFPPAGDFYWCARAGSPLPECVRSLLVDVRGFHVEIDSFDSMMNEIRSIVGFDVPKMLGSLEERQDKIINQLKTFPKTISGLNLILRDVYEFRQKDNAERQQKSKKEAAFLHYVNAYEAELNGNFTQAEAEYRASLELNPEDLNACISLAGVLGHQGKYTEAEQELKSTQPKAAGQSLANVLGSLGYLYSLQDRQSEAAEMYAEAIRVDSKNWITYNGAGLALMKLRRYDEAAAMLHSAAELSPSVYYPAFNLACVLALQGKAGESEKWWSKTGSLWQYLDPVDPYNHATIEACLGHTQQAIEEMRQAIQHGGAGLASLALQSVRLIESAPSPPAGISTLREILESSILGNPDTTPAKG